MNIKTVYDNFDSLREYLGDETILNELVQYLNIDEFTEFFTHCCDAYNIEDFD